MAAENWPCAYASRRSRSKTTKAAEEAAGGSQLESGIAATRLLLGGKCGRVATSLRPPSPCQLTLRRAGLGSISRLGAFQAAHRLRVWGAVPSPQYGGAHLVAVCDAAA